MSKKPAIIGITGKAGAGKDTLAKAISVNQQFQVDHPGGIHIISFADVLKQYVMVKFGLTRWAVYTQEGKESIIPWLGVTVREVLQKEGTELTRDVWCNDFWIQRITQTISGMHETELVIIPDVRFADEAEWVLSCGGMLVGVEGRAAGNLDESQKGHRSEGGVPEELVHTTIDNSGTLMDLQAFVRDLSVSSKNILRGGRSD